MDDLEKRQFPGSCLLVEDIAHASDFLKEAVRTAFPHTEVCAFRNLRDARNWLSKNHDQLAFCLIDLGLPDGSGIEIIREIKLKDSHALIIVVTIYDTDAYLFDALEAGASGYILKEEEPKLVVELLKRITNGEPALSPSIAHRLLDHFRTPTYIEPEEVRLTSRERETLTLLAKGLTVAETAKRLGLSALTVAGYVKIIYQKLHVTNRAEATQQAIKRGLV